MRVAYVCRGVFISGAERSLQTILRNAPGAGIEPVVIGLPDDRMAPWCQSMAFLLPVVARSCTINGGLSHGGTVSALCGSLLRSLKIDLVHTNQIWSYPIVGAAAGKLGLPRVCHMRDEMPADGVRWWCSAGVELVLCISQHIEHMVKPAFLDGTPCRVQTLLNPVTIPPLPTEEQYQLSRAALHLPETGIIFGFVGQIIPVKGLSLLLDSLAEMASDPRWHLAIAGQDPNPGAASRIALPAADSRTRLGRSRDFPRFLGRHRPILSRYRCGCCAVAERAPWESPIGSGRICQAGHRICRGGLAGNRSPWQDRLAGSSRRACGIARQLDTIPGPSGKGNRPGGSRLG